MSETKLDFSVRNVPDSWNAAAEDAPKGDSSDSRHHFRRSGQRLPTGTRPDLVTGTLTGIAMAVITGAAWYLNEVNSAFEGGGATAFFSVVLGALLAVAVRLGAGPAGPEMRVGVGAVLYITGVFGVAYAVTREQFKTLNRRSPSFSEVEELVTTFYLNDLVVIGSWILGLGVMAWATFALKRRYR